MYYNSLNSYLRSEFGCKVYKLALQGGTTCPNRDGTVGTGGCIFCRGGSGDFTAYNDDVRKEIEAAKLKLLEDKIYGTENSESTLPTPDEVIKLLGGVTGVASSNVGV